MGGAGREPNADVDYKATKRKVNHRKTPHGKNMQLGTEVLNIYPQGSKSLILMAVNLRILVQLTYFVIIMQF